MIRRAHWRFAARGRSAARTTTPFDREIDALIHMVVAFWGEIAGYCMAGWVMPAVLGEQSLHLYETFLLFARITSASTEKTLLRE